VRRRVMGGAIRRGIHCDRLPQESRCNSRMRALWIDLQDSL